jgi:hypothetical protein
MLAGINVIVGSCIAVLVVGWLLMGAAKEREHHIAGSIIARIPKKK